MSSSQKISSLTVAALIIAAIGLAGFAAGCNKEQAPTVPEIEPVTVKTQTADQSASLAYSLSYPAMIVSEQESKIVAKANGTISSADFKTGDAVSLGATLLRIDDVNGSAPVQGYSAYQVKQAQLGAQQALASYQLAQNNYSNLIETSAKDLKQVQIAKDQASASKDNLTQTTSETLKAAELSYATAKIATEQARLSYENRKTISGQGLTDTGTNALLAAQTATDGCGTILVSLNSVLELDRESGGNLPYSSSLGALDSQSLFTARAVYKTAKNNLDTYRTNLPTDTAKRLEAAVSIAQQTKSVADAAKNVLDKTPASSALPQSSAIGASLSGLQASVAGYQSQLNGSVTQLTAAKQGLNSVSQNNDATLDGLRKAYEISQQQEKLAAQNVENLKAGNKAQSDNASFGNQAAENQYASAKVKLEAQQSVSRSQMDLARIQYENSVTALEGLMDAHEAIAPMTGTVTKKAVENGTSVTAGQLLAIIGTPDKPKVQFFVDEDHLEAMAPGIKINIITRDGISVSGTIMNVTPQADAVTKRFLVEAKPNEGQGEKLTLGTIASVTVPMVKIAAPGNLLLPISAVDIGQNDVAFFIVEGDKAKRITATIGKIEGEVAEVKADVAHDAKIVVDGNKLIQEGDRVRLSDK